jgi:hypothetical protein
VGLFQKDVVAVVSLRPAAMGVSQHRFPFLQKWMSLREEIERGEVNVPHAFAARCKRCESETVYYRRRYEI